MSRTSKLSLTVPLGIGLGILAGILVFGHSIGLGLALYLVIWVMSLLIHVRVSGVRLINRNLTLLVPILFFAATLVIRADQSLQLLSLITGMCALLLLTYFMTSGNIANQSLSEYLLKLAISGIDMFFLPMQELSVFINYSPTRKKLWRRIMIGIQIGLILIVIAVALMIWLIYANADVRQTLTTKLNPYWLGKLPELLILVNFVIIVSWLSIGILASALNTRDVPRTVRQTVFDNMPLERPSVPIPLEGVRYRRGMQVLIGICIVCGWILLTQSPHLFAGTLNPKAWGYAQFSTLAEICVALLYYLIQKTVRETPRQIALFRGLAAFAIILDLGVLAAAFQDLNLNAVAGNSDWSQIASYALVPWLGVILIGLLVSLYWKRPRVNAPALAVLIALFGAVATLDMLNPDLIIGWQKVQQDNVSITYLTQIPVEAVPALISLVDAPRDAQRALVRDSLRMFRDQLLSSGTGDWRDYNVGRNNALELLDGVKDKLFEKAVRVVPVN